MKKLSYVTDEKGHGYFRKNKAVKGLATAIAIGGVLISSNNAKADEVVDVTATGNDVLAEAGDAALATVVAETTATNYSEPQPEATAEHLQALANEGQVVGEGITSPVESSSLDQAVAEAVAVEVIVTESQTPIVKDNLNEAQTALDNQEKKVDEAKETKVEVDSILAGNTEKAKKAEVIETPTKAVTYTDDNKLAKEDAKEQEARVDVAVETQVKVSNQLPQAVREAIESGVEVSGVSFDGDKVVFDNTVRYADTVKALDNLAKQVAELKNAGATQEEIDSLISQAVADLRKTGAKVTLSNSANAEGVETALNKAKNYVTKLAEIQEAQSKINTTQSSALTSANSNSLKVNTATTPFETSNIQEGVANAESNAKALTDGVASQSLGNSIINDAVADARSKGTAVEVSTTPQIVTSSQAETIAKQQAEAIALVVTENDKKRQAWETAKSEFQKAYAEYQRLLAERNTALANAESVKALNAQIEQANAELNATIVELNKQIEDAVNAMVAGATTDRFTATSNQTGTVSVSSTAEAQAQAQAIIDQLALLGASASGADVTLDEATRATNKQIMESVGLTYTGDFATDKASVDKWNAENAGEKVDSTTTLGITTTDGTTVVRDSGSPVAVNINQTTGINAIIQEGNTFLTNMVLSASKAGTPISFTVKNTSNGDVKLTFFDYVQDEVAATGAADTWVAGVDVKTDGSIVVNAGLLGYGADIGANVEGGTTGGSSLVGSVAKFIKSYKVRVETSAGVQYLTINDIDNGQTITLSGGTATQVGSGMSGSGLTYTGTGGNVVQAGIGQLGSHGVEFDYGSSSQVNTEVSASNADGAKMANLILGLFGPSSIHENKTNVPAISISEPNDVYTPYSGGGGNVDYQLLSAVPTPTNPVPEVPEEPTEPVEPTEPTYATAKATPLQVEVDYQETILTTSVVTPLVGIEATGIQVTVPTHPIEI